MGVLTREAIGIVEWELGVTVEPTSLTGYNGHLVEAGIVVGALLIAGAHVRARHTSHDSGWAPAHIVNDLVEDEAWRASARSPLGVAPTLMRHLFVWVGESDHLTQAAMEADTPPAPPLLPPEVSTVWVARLGMPSEDLLADRTWQTNESGEWESLGAIRRNRRRVPIAAG